MSKSKKSLLRILVVAVLALFCVSCLVGFAACGGDDSYDEGYSAGYEAGYSDGQTSGGEGEGGGSGSGGSYQDGYDAGYADGVKDSQSAAVDVTSRHYTGYTSEAAAEAAAEEMNVALAEESITLLKNKENALPLESGAKVSVLGIAQDCLVETTGSITSSLTAAGFDVNPTLEHYYLHDNYSADDVSGSLLATAPYGDESDYLNDTNHASLEASISSYNDAVIVVLARGTAGESSDRSTNTGEAEDEKYLDVESGWAHEAQETDENSNAQKHELELTASEQSLIKEAEDTVGNGKVIVLYSSSNTFEMANLQDDSKIDSILWMGRMGDGGIAAVGEILSGEVNPSGKTVDEWTRDFTNDPTYANTIVTAYNDEAGNSLRVTMGSEFMDQMYEAMMPGALDLGSIDYEEDIYLGYKWYETYWKEASAEGSTLKPAINGEDLTAGSGGETVADQWYDYNVVYPYGYGLSYTSFSYTLGSLKTDAGADVGTSISSSSIYNSSNKSGVKSLTASVEVTNTGDVAGKETVQVYVEAPYTSGGVEKPAWTLVGFGKTDTLETGESETLDITFNIQDFASFDYSDANNNGSNVYELDAGSYTVHIMESSSHENMDSSNAAYASSTFTLDATTVMDLDDYSGNEVEALFSDPSDDYYSNAAGAIAGTMYTPLDEDEDSQITSTLLSRADFDGTQPTAPTCEINGQTVAGGLITSEYGSSLDEIRDWWGSDMYMYADSNTSIDDGAVWEKTAEDIPTNWTQGTGKVGANGMYAITFSDMAGVPLENTEAWDEFMNQLTWDELCAICNNGYHLTVAVPTIGKLQGKDENGPNYTYNGTTWVGTPFIAATWNQELAGEYGQMVGTIALYQGLTGWYGPGMNTRRNQFAGRVPEYYSQDGIHAGYIGAAVVAGAESMGINVYAKHFAMYDICTEYCGSASECTEQVMREIYLKPFQMAFQEGGGTATMTAFAKIGKVYAGQNYALIQKLARDEWGWTGHAVTDISTNSFGASMDGLVRAGADIPDGNWQDSTDGLSGSWVVNDTYPSGMVYLGAEGSQVASPTQWYCVRMAATRVLHDTCNSAANFNGITQKSYSVSVSAGTAVNTTVTLSELDNTYSIGTMYLASGNTLGLSFVQAGNTVTITGTPTGAGSFTLRVYVDQWIPIDVVVTITS